MIFASICSVLGAGIAMGLGSIGSAVGEGMIAMNAVDSLGRQPKASGKIVRVMIISQAVTETASIFALVISLLLVFQGDVDSVFKGVTFIAAGLTIGLGTIGSGLGAGLPGSAAMKGIGRQPKNSDSLTVHMIIGQAVTQTSTIFSLTVALILIMLPEREGLGNKFLDNIRMTSVIAHVVRCFDSADITHVDGSVNPIRDVNIINNELILADLMLVEKMHQTQQKKIKTNDSLEIAKLDLLSRLMDCLSDSKPARILTFTDDERIFLNDIPLITMKKVIYVANVDEDGLSEDNSYVLDLRKYANEEAAGLMKICALIESELVALDPEETSEFLNELGLQESGLNQLSRVCFDLLGLQTYLTTGEKETRAWTIRKGALAPEAAGAIHTDFEKGFIRANIISYNDFVACNGIKAAKEKGLLRQEGKDYVMQDGDVVEFLFT